MLAFMDCFHLLAMVVIIGLPLAFFIRRFESARIRPPPSSYLAPHRKKAQRSYNQYIRSECSD